MRADVHAFLDEDTKRQLLALAAAEGKSARAKIRLAIRALYEFRLGASEAKEKKW